MAGTALPRKFGLTVIQHLILVSIHISILISVLLLQCLWERHFDLQTDAKKPIISWLVNETQEKLQKCGGRGSDLKNFNDRDDVINLACLRTQSCVG
jgi:hypothetical protein